MESTFGLVIFILIMIFRIMGGLNEAARKRQAPPRPARPAVPAPEAAPSPQPHVEGRSAMRPQVRMQERPQLRLLEPVRPPLPPEPAPLPDVPLLVPAEEPAAAAGFDLDAVRQGIIFAEILGPPRALRRHRAGRR